MMRVTEGLFVLADLASDVARDDVLIGVLLAGLTSSALLLVSMLTTSWGDHQPGAKALVLSLMVHVSCFAGLVVLISRLEYVDVEGLLSGGEAQVRPVQAYPDDETYSDTYSDLALSERPVWDRVLPSETNAVERRQLEPRSLARITEPRRSVAAEPRELATVTDPAQLPDLSPPEPEVVAEAAPAPRPTDGDSPQAPAPEAVIPEARSEVAAPRGATRQLHSLPGDPTDSPAQPPVRQGRADDAAIASPEVSSPIPGSNILAEIPLPDGPKQVEGGEAGIERGALAGAATAPIPQVPETGGGVESSGDEPDAPAASALATTNLPRRTGTFRMAPGAAAPQVERIRTATPPGGAPPAAITGPPAAVAAIGDVRPAPRTQAPVGSGGMIARDAGVPGHLGLRKLSQTPEVAIERGASQESLQAVELSLAWLARKQEPDGRWDADRHESGRIRGDHDVPGRRFGTGDVPDREYAGREADAGVTGLALLTFLAHGHNHDDGEYARTVERGLAWLIAQQEPNGYLGGNATRHARMYCHGMATYAIAEAYAMQRDKTFDNRLRRPLERAVAYIVDQQNPTDGGWRYERGQVSDMSMFGWQLMALKSAYEALGVPMPAEPRKKMVQFLIDRSVGPRHGLAGYGGNNDARNPTPAMTAEALFCKQMLGIPRNHPQCIEALEYLSKHPPRRDDWNLYYWYYATLAMRAHGGDYWRHWNEMLRDSLVAEQRTQGDLAGSWDPIGPWGAYGGRIYSTALASLCLQVYWRYPSVAPPEVPFEPR